MLSPVFLAYRINVKAVPVKSSVASLRGVAADRSLDGLGTSAREDRTGVCDVSQTRVMSIKLPYNSSPALHLVEIALER